MAYASKKEEDRQSEDKKSKSISEEEQAELLEQFKSDLAESNAYMKPIQQRMDKDYEQYRNWRGQGSDISSDTFSVSDFFEYVETVVPIVTNNRIRALVHSDFPDYVTHAKGINDILDHTYDVNNWDYMSQEIFRQSLICRSGLIYTGFDDKYKNGTGKLCIDQVNMRWAWIDPNPTQLEDSRYFFCVTPKRKTQVFKEYPNKVDEIKASIQKNKPSSNNTNDNQGADGWFKTWIGTIKNFLTFNGQNQAKILGNPFNEMQEELQEQQKHKNVIAFIEYWYRDDKDEWRKSCWADDVLLTDEPNPFWHGGLPYDILSPVKDLYSCLGVPMSEQIESMTLNRNLMMNYALSNSKLHAKPPLLFNTSFGNVKDPQKLKEMADEGVIPVSNPDMIDLNSVAAYMNVPVLPGYSVNIFDQLGAIKDAVTGVNDSFRGTQQATSGKEVQLQQEAAYTRIKTMIDQFELTNKKIAEKVIINAMQFYTQHRGFRIKGDYMKYDATQQIAQKQGQELPFEVQPIAKGLDEQGQPVHDRTEFFLFANPNEWTKLDTEGVADDEEEGESDSEGETDDKPAETNGAGRNADKGRKSRQSEDEQEEVEKAFKVLQFTVEIEAGSSLPQSRLARREESTQLFQLGAIDQESLLEMFDWPDREEVMKRMQEQARQAQEAQAQAAQAEAQAKMQAEQMKIQAQMEMEQMKQQGELQKQEAANRGKVAEKGAENSGSSIAEMLGQIRQSNPDAANMSDEELISLLTGAQPSEQGSHGGGLAETLDQVRKSNPEAAELSDDELITALSGQG